MEKLQFDAIKRDLLGSKAKSKLSKIGNSKICPMAVIFKDDKMLIGLRNYTPDKYKQISVWTTPGGRCDDGELVEKTLRREVLEETGITNLKVNNFLGKVSGVKESDVVYLFDCATNQDPQLLEPEKFTEWRWVDISEIPPNFINKEALNLLKKWKNYS